MPWKVSIFWTAQADRLGGWSENFWNNIDSFDTVKAKAIALTQAFDKVHGTQTYATNIRISDITTPRNADNVPLVSAADPPADVSTSSDIQNTAANMRLFGAGNYSTSQWIRSCHDGDVNTGGRWNPLPSTANALGVVLGIMNSAANGWCIRVQDRTVPRQLVSGASMAGIITVTGHGYASGQKVKITQAKGTMGINGVWRITVIDSNTFSLIGYQTPEDSPVYKGDGLVYKVSRILVPVTNLKIVRATSIKTGRPFGQLTGKAKKKKKVSAG